MEGTGTGVVSHAWSYHHPREAMGATPFSTHWLRCSHRISKEVAPGLGLGRRAGAEGGMK